MAEILASLNDINAHLPSLDDEVVIEATAENTNLIQLSVSRIIRAYLSREVPTATLMSWSEPTDTPDIIREAAAMMIAAQLYVDFAARTSIDVEDIAFSQRKYDEAMALLNKILSGEIVLEGIPVEVIDS